MYIKKNKKIIFAIIAMFSFAGFVFAAPVSNLFRSIVPETDNQYYVGTTSPSNQRYEAIFLGTATSTAAMGFNLSGGCYAINGTCITGGGGAGTVTGTGGINQLSYWTSNTNLAATSSPTVSFIIATSSTASVFPVASTTSFSAGNLIQVNGTGTSTFTGGATFDTLKATNGVAITNGCFSVNGACISGGGGGTPANPLNSIQYNNSGAFGGSANLIWDNTNVRLGIATGTPGTTLSIAGNGLFNNMLTVGGILKATSTALFATDGGSVGIATTAPGSVLSVNGPFLAQATSTILGGGLVAQAILSTTTLGFYANTTQYGYPVEYLDENGRVAIGTTSPAAWFHVAREGGKDIPVMLIGSRTAPTPAQEDYLVINGGGSQTSSMLLIKAMFNNTSEFTVNANGGVDVTGSLTVGTEGFNNNFGAYGYGIYLGGYSGSVNGIITNAGNGTGGGTLQIGLPGENLAIYSGKIGIASTTPGVKLSVNGGAGFTDRVSAPSFTATSTTNINTFPLASTTSFSADNIIQVNGAGTSTFTGGISSGGLASSKGLNLTGGTLDASNLGAKLGEIGSATSSLLVATSTDSSTGSVQVNGNIFFKGQNYGEWIPMTNVAPSTIFDCALGNRFYVTVSLAQNILTPKNCQSGYTAILKVQEDTTGGRAILFATSSMVNGQYASTTINAVNWFGVIFNGNFGYVLAATSTNPTN